MELLPVSYAPSASLLRQLAGVRPGGRASVIVGAADAHAPHINDEVLEVAAQVPDAVVLVGPEATVGRLEAAVSDARLLHLACHGWFSQASPLASGVRLGDQWLTVRDLYGWSLPGSVVVLSGCETGRAVVGGGDDLVGLVRGLVTAGAAAVVTSLWALHDETARNLVVRMYGFWHNGASERAGGLVSAVRSAQLRMLEENAHPVFWAPLMVVGSV